MYKFSQDGITGVVIGVQRAGANIPFDARNTDCQQFLIDWKAGVGVLNPDGSAAAYNDGAVRALGLEPV